MRRFLSLLFVLLVGATCWATTYTVHPTDSPTTIYGTIQNAACGDTVNINAGTYSNANSNIELIYITGKACTSGTVLLIQAADQANKPLFDYTGFPLDGGTGACGATYPTTIPHSYGGGDFMRGAWQITNSSYVTFNGLLIKGATSCSTTSVAGIRFNSAQGADTVNHLIVENSTFQQNWDGLFGEGTNTLIQNNVFISNGSYSEDQEHQYYDSGGDQLTIRYNTFLGQGCEGIPAGTLQTWCLANLPIGAGGDTCCIKKDGTLVNTGGGQTLHMRSWNSFVYGNWMQDGRDYEWDMSAPEAVYAPGGVTTDMYMQFYGNVVVSNVTPQNSSKVMTFTGYMPNSGTCAPGVVGCPGLTMHMDTQWNTFYVRYPKGTNNTCLGGSTQCYQYNLFQLNNYTAAGGNLPQHGADCVGCDALGGIALHFANNEMYFVHEYLGATNNHSLIEVSGNGSPWTIAGANNWFGAPDRGGVINICGTLVSVWNGTCLLTSSTNNVTSAPPFVNLSVLNLAPNIAGAFGSADTTQTLKAPDVAYTPAAYTALSTYTDIGALQYNTSPVPAIPPSCTPASGAVPQTITCTNPNSGTTVMCYNFTGSPATNGVGTGCSPGTIYTTPLVISTTETLYIIAGVSTLTDSFVVPYTYSPLYGGSALYLGTGLTLGTAIQ